MISALLMETWQKKKRECRRKDKEDVEEEKNRKELSWGRDREGEQEKEEQD